MDSSLFDATHLNQLAEKFCGDYAQADPFPHVVIDGLVPNAVLAKVLEEFPAPSEPFWGKYIHANSRKLASNDLNRMGPISRELIRELNAPLFLQFLEKLTGMAGIIPDPYLQGGGLHQIERGGFLKVHADFNLHPKLNVDRRLNLLLYLNRDWQEDWGGQLELWDRSMSSARKKIHPLFNRCVVFSTTDFSYHGHPDPLTCPENRTRKSIALYYYTNGRPLRERSAAHSTLYRQRPQEKVPLWRTLLGAVKSKIDGSS